MLWQIILTRKAVRDTGDATKAMLEANKIARSAYEASTRPVLIFERCDFEERGTGNIVAKCIWKNTGGSPARIVGISYGNDFSNIFVADRIISNIRSRFTYTLVMESIVYANGFGENGQVLFEKNCLADDGPFVSQNFLADSVTYSRNEISFVVKIYYRSAIDSKAPVYWSDIVIMITKKTKEIGFSYECLASYTQMT
ncbi:hypothetical protein RLDS_20125 [Sphingobium lactosutens DS20]|uniref:Uncharacterized protein n=1 Tax=Sphingobium lactosutens DS20 TaxID=1331060 RepID=T0HJV2_9SPHN|nr:hypothetical protein RLDS_20125 [Sphingobium lactosutens DS20]